MRCARCDYRTDPQDEQPARVQLLEHATDAAHPLCQVCRRSLPVEDRGTCEQCLTESRSLLAGIVTMWAELPTHLGHPSGARYDESVSASKDKPLLGGDALVLAGPGGSGQTGRRLWPSELKQGLVQNYDGREHAVDNHASDAPSVAQLLTEWEDDWRHTRTEPAAALPARSTATVISAAAGYLEVHARWAARAHPAFDQYVTDLRQLHHRLERATGRDERIVKADAECFRCGAGALVREIRAGRPCHHDTATLPAFPGEWELDDDGLVLLDENDKPVRVPVAERRRRYELAMEQWEADHGRCQQQGGYADRWTCQRCGDTYDWQRYLLAVRTKVRGTPAGDWGLPGHLALVHGVPVKTILTWARRGVVAVACILGDSRMRVSAEDVRGRVRQRTVAEERRRRAEQKRREREQTDASRPWRHTG